MSDGDPGQGASGEPAAAPFRVGDWTAEPAWNRLRRDGTVVKLEPRVMRLLTVLAAAPGRPLGRQELLDKVWPDVLVNEEALSRAVSQLRRALGDDPKAPRYLETVHKGGYCLIAPVDREPAPAVPPPATNHVPRVLAALLLLILVGVGLAVVDRRPTAAPPDQPTRTLTPVTSEPGREIDPAVSPDGSRVAYLARNGMGYQLFVRALDGAGPVRLTNDRRAKGHPVWSPSGHRIAFVASDGDAAAIHLLALQGGRETKLIDLPAWSYGLDWSPDGRMLAYSDAAPGEAATIVLLDIASRAARPIARSADSSGDAKPVFSPDGKKIAFVRSDALDRQRIVVADIDGNEARVLLATPRQIRGLDWTPEGDALVYSARAGRRFGLWRLATDAGGAPELLSIEGGDLWNPSIARDGRVVVEEVDQDSDIWRADLARGAAAPFIRSTADDYDPAFAPSGGALAFVSERSGAAEVWLQEPDGRTRRLTDLGSTAVGRISWSPDTRRLAFMTEKDGIASIYVMGVDGTAPTGLRTDRRAHVPIGWGPDGNSLYILSPIGGGWRLELLNLPDGKAQVVAPRVRVAAPTPDGRSILVVPMGEGKLLLIRPDDGVVRQFRLPPLPHLVALLPAGDAVYLVEDAFGTAVIHRLSVGLGTVAPVLRLDEYGGGTLSLTPDGKWLAYTHARETANDIASTKL